MRHNKILPAKKIDYVFMLENHGFTKVGTNVFSSPKGTLVMKKYTKQGLIDALIEMGRKSMLNDIKENLTDILKP